MPELAWGNEARSGGKSLHSRRKPNAGATKIFHFIMKLTLLRVQTNGDMGNCLIVAQRHGFY